MGSNVDIKVEIDSACKTPQITIKTDSKTEFVERIVDTIEHCAKGDYHQITAYRGDSVVLLYQWDIVRIYTEKRKVIICTEDEQFESKISLHDMEEILNDDAFTRISRFEIVNINKIYSFDLSISGTIRITFLNSTETWVARRYVRSIADKLKEKCKGVLL